MLLRAGLHIGRCGWRVDLYSDHYLEDSFGSSAGVSETYFVERLQPSYLLLLCYTDCISVHHVPVVSFNNNT